MPRPIDPDRFPDAYWALLDRAATSPVEIEMPLTSPAKDASGLRQSLQAFLNAVIAQGGPRAAQARSVHVKSIPNTRKCVMQPRAHGIYAQAVAAALGGDPVATAEAAFRRLQQSPEL